MGPLAGGPFLALLGLWVAIPLTVLDLRAHAHHRWFPWVLESGYDQLQYFSWTRDAGGHWLAANLFRIGPSHHVFTDPFFFVTGLLARTGLSPPLAFWALAPVAVVSVWAGSFAWAREHLGSWRPAAVAALLAVFYLAPVYVLADWVGAGTGRLGAAAGPLFIAPLLWGGLPAAIAVGLVPLVLLLVARGRAAPAALLALVASWVHPWQGEQLAIVCAAAFALDRRPWRERGPLALTAVATIPPIAYFALLGHYDYDWRVARVQAHSVHVELIPFLFVLAPLAVPAWFGVARGWRDDVGERLLTLLPAACLLAFAITPSVRAHALVGISIPLSILAVRGWLRLGLSRTAGALIAAAVVVASAVQLSRLLADAVDGPFQPYAIDPGERAALQFLERSPVPGGVLARVPLAALVPGYSGRQTWLGHESWTPNEVTRSALANQLIGGDRPARRARRFVRATGARFVLADCHASPALRATLRPLTAQRRDFGCASVYVLRGP